MIQSLSVLFLLSLWIFLYECVGVCVRVCLGGSGFINGNGIKITQAAPNFNHPLVSYRFEKTKNALIVKEILLVFSAASGLGSMAPYASLYHNLLSVILPPTIQMTSCHYSLSCISSCLIQSFQPCRDS